VYFDNDDASGGAASSTTDSAVAAAPPAESATDAPVDETPAPDPTADPAEAGDGEGVEQLVDETPDWGAKITEWGGQEAVEQALRLNAALQTPDGIRALYIEAGKALGFGEAAILEMLEDDDGGDGGEQEPTIEELLADPDRQLTVREVQRILEHNEATKTQ